MDFVDEIALTGLRAFGYHGVYPHERRDGQEFVVDVTLYLPTAAAAASDDVADTVDYGEVAQKVVAVVTGEPVNLLERLAERIADTVLADVRVQTAAVTVHKPGAPIPFTFDDVSVTIRRSRPVARTAGFGIEPR